MLGRQSWLAASLAVTALALAGCSDSSPPSVGPNTSTPNTSAPSTPSETAYVGIGDTIYPIDLATGAVGSSITVPGLGTEFYIGGIAITPSGQTAYVTNDNTPDGTVTPIDLATGTTGSPIAVPAGALGIAITPNGQTAYVAGDSGITPIDLATAAAGSPIPTGGDATGGIAISPNGQTAYLAVNNDTGTPISVERVDLANATLSGVVGSGVTDNGLARGIAISPNGQTVYVIAENDSSPFVAPIDLATGAVGSTISVANGGYVGGIAITPNGQTAYVATIVGVPAIYPIDLATSAVGSSVKVPSSDDDIFAVDSQALGFAITP